MTIAHRFTVIGVLALAVAGGCPGDGDPTNASGSESSGIPPVSTTEGQSTTPGATAATSDGASGEGSASTEPSADSGSGTVGSDTTEGNTSVGDPTNPLDCGGTIYACGNGMDDDGDGFTDLFDPECTGPCDDDESSFQTGLPGDNVDCKQDCFFDGNSGQGDDGCIWNLTCDPANPGGNIGCEYTGGNNCNNQPPNQAQGCIDFCEPFVPPGCDCFGCCTVQTPQGPIDIFLNSGPDCSLDNLGACTTCTSQIDDCGVPCVPEKCQVCFGETELPEGCDENTCIGGDTCNSDQPDSCPPDYFCYLGCCYPPPPG